MKINKLILIVLIFGLSFMLVCGQTKVFATSGEATTYVESIKPEAPSNQDALSNIINRLLGFLQIASVLVAVLMIAITGFNYIVGGAEVKKEMKEKMFPIILGLILVFGAATVVKFILSVTAFAA